MLEVASRLEGNSSKSLGVDPLYSGVCGCETSALFPGVGPIESGEPLEVRTNATQLSLPDTVDDTDARLWHPWAPHQPRPARDAAHSLERGSRATRSGSALSSAGDPTR
jgi:hypothetical protein